MADQYMIGALVRVQVVPQLVEVNMPAVPPPWSFATAASLAPSAEEAIDCQEFEGALLNVQVIPPSAERKIGAPTAPITPDAAATILVPSAEQATARHATLLEATVLNQAAPELVETYIEPSVGGVVSTVVTATNLVPSADDATDRQTLLGALVQVQFWPGAEMPPQSKHPETVIADNSNLCFISLVTSCGRSDCCCDPSKVEASPLATGLYPYKCLRT
jgi:hypothetical protein